MNATIVKFGFPHSLVREFEHWVVLVRPAQVTLGSMILAARSEATAYGALPPEAFAEQGLIVAKIETALGEFCDYERVNYLMLMMVDPHVHFHVIPRYSAPREWDGVQFGDEGWPGPPALASALKLGTAQISKLASELASRF